MEKSEDEATAEDEAAGAKPVESHAGLGMDVQGSDCHNNARQGSDCCTDAPGSNGPDLWPVASADSRGLAEEKKAAWQR